MQNRTHQGNLYDDQLIKYKRFFAEFSMLELAGKTVVPFLGITGSGKSTAIGIQLGGVYRKKKKEFPLDCEDPNNQYPKTSDGMSSKTIQIKVFEDKQRGLLYLDTAGFDESRGDLEKQWSHYCMRLLFGAVNAFRSIVITISYEKIFRRGASETLVKLTEDLDEILLGEEAFYNTMVFLVTDVDKDISLDDINKKLDDELGILKGKFKERHKFLKQKCRLSNTDSAFYMAIKGANTTARVGRLLSQSAKTTVSNLFDFFQKNLHQDQASSSASPTEDAEEENTTGLFAFDRSKAEKEYPAQLKEFDSYARQIRLLETMKRNRRTVISYPNGSAQCAKIKAALVQAIADSPGVGKTTLKQISELRMIDSSFEIQEIACRLAADYNKNLSKELTLLEKYQESYNGVRQDIQDIENDNRSGLICSAQGKRDAVEQRISENTATAQRLKYSEKPVCLDKKHVKSDFKNAFFYVVMCAFCMGYREASYHHNGAPFTGVKYLEIDGNKFTHYEEVYNQRSSTSSGKAKGELKVTFTSHYGHELNLKVILMTEEKDHPDTALLIGSLLNDVNEDQNELKRLNRYLSNLQHLEKETLIALLKSQSNELKNKLLEAEEQLNTPILTEVNGDLVPMENTTQRDAVRGIASFFILLNKVQAWDPHLPSSSRKIKDNFMLHYQNMLNLCQENSFIVENLPSFTFYEVDSGRANNKYLENTLSPISAMRSCSIFSCFNLANCELTLGGSALVVGFSISLQAIALKDSFPLEKLMLFSNLLIAVGSFLFLAGLQRKTANVMDRISRFVNGAYQDVGYRADRVIDPIAREFLRTLVLAQREGLRASREVSSSVRRLSDNIHVDVSLRSISFGSIFSLFNAKVMDQLFGPADTNSRRLKY